MADQTREVSTRQVSSPDARAEIDRQPLARLSRRRIYSVMTSFNATIEFLSGQKAAIVTLTDSTGEWAGSCRIEAGKSRSSLYELGYAHASVSAAHKGGRLETYRVAA